MRTFLKIIAAVILVIILLGVFFAVRPMTASDIFWPVVEVVAIEDFVGVTTDGNIQPNVFSIEKTGVSTKPVMNAARRFLDTLTPEQRARTLFPVDDAEWQKWANIHLAKRQGTGFLEFTPEQAEAALALISSGLSERGYQTAIDIMRLEGYLADLLDNHVEYGEKRYWLTIMGEPSETEPWGWQLDGHHLIVNFFVLGDQVVMTPTFMGSEPPFATQGKLTGLSILDEELEAGLVLINSLMPDQKKLAIVSENKHGNNARGELFQDNVVVPYEGIRLNVLNEVQRGLAIELIQLYTGHMRKGHDTIKLNEILKHWDNTYFSWVGDTGPEAVFYYRIHSPVVMIMAWWQAVPRH
ncbi:MAG: DUF3500 domain-containing protein [Pseudomonadota bacterium]